MTEVKSHEIIRHLVEKELVPEHAERTESVEFRKNRQLLIDQGYGCWICGVKEHLQAHHILEWCLWNIIDPVKALDILKAIDPYGLTAKDPYSPMETPDDLRNLWLFCQEHHIQKDTGIHEVTFPVWVAQKAVKTGDKITE